MKLSRLYILLSLMYFGCNSDMKSDELDLLTLDIENDYKIDLVSYNNLIIIPSSGCNECISEIEELLLQESQNETSDIVFLITGYKFSKSISVRLGNSVLNRSFVLLDTLGRYDLNVDAGKPLIFTINEENMEHSGEVMLVDNKYVVN